MDYPSNENPLKTRWYHYIAAFFAGVFLVNIIPHYIHGITGKPFPTPFADPPGKGLSSSVLNVLWATINFLISFSIFYLGKISKRSKWIWIAIFAGGIVMSFYLAHYFGSQTTL
ncbi:hypothetical protein ACFP1I_31895 [Dyadobacter subterraneus]|uniref:Uncharacterized protein n=1 Tax=Dyadobacter subterraneus TaxID=2773304 RepID=A0ABR9W941_9BACT|nr:hypothetical protein [Dyadobacter subterraneus]MBE9461983.1 hypothetical protein [Dyadobacter subterraneus]